MRVDKEAVYEFVGGGKRGGAEVWTVFGYCWVDWVVEKGVVEY